MQEDVSPLEETPRAPSVERLPSECGTEELDPVAEGAKVAGDEFPLTTRRASEDLDGRSTLLERRAFHRGAQNESNGSNLINTPWWDSRAQLRDPRLAPLT